MKPAVKYSLLGLIVILAIGAGIFIGQNTDKFNFLSEKQEKNEVKETKTDDNNVAVTIDGKTVTETKTPETTETPKDKTVTESTKVETPTVSANQPGNSSSEELIKLYYQKLAQGDFQGAYDMKKYKKMDFSVFQGYYQNLQSSKFLDFIEVAKDQYDFLVELTNKDGTKEVYDVWMQVEGNLLNTISSVSTDETPALRVAYSEEGDYLTLFLVQNGTKTKIDTARHSKNEDFNNVEISADKNYLIYFKELSESNPGKIYSINDKKVLLEFTPSRGLYGFTYDSKHFYNCLEDGMFGGEVKTYSVPAFTEEKNLKPNGSSVFQCNNYDKNTNTLHYKLFTYGFNNQSSYSYNFDTGNVSQ